MIVENSRTIFVQVKKPGRQDQLVCAIVTLAVLVRTPVSTGLSFDERSPKRSCAENDFLLNKNRTSSGQSWTLCLSLSRTVVVFRWLLYDNLPPQVGCASQVMLMLIALCLVGRFIV